MSKMKLNLVASALIGAVAFSGATIADPLEKLHAAERKIQKDAAKSQIKTRPRPRAFVKLNLARTPLLRAA